MIDWQRNRLVYHEPKHPIGINNVKGMTFVPNEDAGSYDITMIDAKTLGKEAQEPDAETGTLCCKRRTLVSHVNSEPFSLSWGDS